MNVFEIILLDVVLFSFPLLIYLVFLSINKNIKFKSKNLYSNYALISSFFLAAKYGVKEPKILPVLVLNSIVVLLFIENKYVLANFFSILIILIYKNAFSGTYMLTISYILLNIVYVVKRYKKIDNILFLEMFVFITSFIYYIWIYKYNYIYYTNLIYSIILSYFFIANIICLIYEIGKKILNEHFTYKELQQEKQIRLSLFKITHEIKNPIAVCKGYLDMINVNDKKQVNRYIPIIKSEIERLLILLQDFLFINKTNIEFDVMDINMLIEENINKINDMLIQKKIYLKLNLIDDEVFINGDYNKLSQVIINILKNSIEAIEKDNGEIYVSSKVKKNNYYLIIKDNGIGMKKETLEKIKEPFFSTKRRGSGLGVPLIYEIVEAHQGKIEYNSEYGKGTTVTIKFPLYT